MNILGIYSIITYSLFYRAATAKSNTKIKIISFRILSAFMSMFNLNPITLHSDSTLYVSYDKIMNCTISKGFIQFISIVGGVDFVEGWD